MALSSLTWQSAKRLPASDMTPTSLTSWMSSGKPLLAVAMAQLVERGQIDLQDRVVDRVPEFGANGKDGIDLRHLLTHTSGLTNDRPSASTWDELVGAICVSLPVAEWVPGRSGGIQCWQRLGHSRRGAAPR